MEIMSVLLHYSVVSNKIMAKKQKKQNKTKQKKKQKKLIKKMFKSFHPLLHFNMACLLQHSSPYASFYSFCSMHFTRWLNRNRSEKGRAAILPLFPVRGSLDAAPPDAFLILYLLSAQTPSGQISIGFIRTNVMI